MPHNSLRNLVQQLGSQKAAAKRLGFTPSFINDVLQGRREMTEALASKLGFKRVITFVPKGPK
jgi:DNA-binding transcriptional regulator YdaS (Cro superfamily)